MKNIYLTVVLVTLLFLKVVISDLNLTTLAQVNNIFNQDDNSLNSLNNNESTEKKLKEFNKLNAIGIKINDTTQLVNIRWTIDKFVIVDGIIEETKVDTIIGSMCDFMGKCENLFYYFLNDELIVILDSDLSKSVYDIEEDMIFLKSDIFFDQAYEFKLLCFSTKNVDFISYKSILISIEDLEFIDLSQKSYSNDDIEIENTSQTETSQSMNEDSTLNDSNNEQSISPDNINQRDESIIIPESNMIEKNIEIELPEKCTKNNYTIRWKETKSSKDNNMDRTMFSITLNSKGKPYSKIFEIPKDRTRYFKFNITLDADKNKTITIEGIYEDGMLMIQNPLDLIDASIQIDIISYQNYKKVILNSTKELDFKKCKKQKININLNRNGIIIVSCLGAALLITLISSILILIFKYRNKKSHRYIPLDDQKYQIEYIDITDNGNE